MVPKARAPAGAQISPSAGRFNIDSLFLGEDGNYMKLDSKTYKHFLIKDLQNRSSRWPSTSTVGQNEYPTDGHVVQNLHWQRRNHSLEASWKARKKFTLPEIILTKSAPATADLLQCFRAQASPASPLSSCTSTSRRQARSKSHKTSSDTLFQNILQLSTCNQMPCFLIYLVEAKEARDVLPSAQKTNRCESMFEGLYHIWGEQRKQGIY